MIFTKHSNVVVEFSEIELAQSLSRLEASSRDDVDFVNTGGGLLLIDAAWIIGRRILEQYLIGSDSTLPIGITFSPSLILI